MWKRLRILALLAILAVVVLQAWKERSALQWKRTLNAVVYPINVDADAGVATYIESLKVQDFEPLAEFFADEGDHHLLNLARPINIVLGEEVFEVPPEPPVGGSTLSVIWWSLQLRWYAWRNSPGDIEPDMRLYLLFHDPQRHPVLGHSTALAKGRIGRVNQYGRQDYLKQNLVILAHEMLHALNATDKYDLQTTLPVFPDGYAAPDKVPRYPQEYAELMGGRVPINETQAEIPAGLDQVLIGDLTAREIGWVN